MKLVTYRLSGAEHVGALTADGKDVLPLPAADMNTLIETMTLAAVSYTHLTLPTSDLV